MRRLLLLTTCLFVITGLSACGDDGGGGATGDDTGGEVQTTPLTFGDGSEVWLRVETGGGFVPMIYNLRQTPSLLLFDDGRLVRRIDDAGLDQLVPQFEAVQLDESGTAALLDTFAAVVDGPDPGAPGITDNPSTTIEVTTDGDTRELSIYALGYDDGLADAEVAARDAATAAIDGAYALDGAEAFVPEEWLALSTYNEVEPSTPFDWPLAPERLASVDEPNVCTRLTGDEVDQVITALDGLTGAQVEIALRPVLTGAERCNLSDADQFVER
jgi:hypothetical protein